MVCEKTMEKSEFVDSGSILTNSAGKSEVTSENKISSDSTSSNQSSASNIKCEADKDNPSSSCDNYHYPGYNGSFGQSDNGKDHSPMGVQTNNSSVAYYMPGYNPYATYGAEALPSYGWDCNYSGDPSAVSNAASGNVKSNPNRAAPVRSNGIKPSMLYSNMSKLSSVNLNSKSRLSVASSNVTKPKFDTQQNKPLNKSGSYYPPSGYANVYQPSGSKQSSSSQTRRVYGNAGPTPVGYKSNPRTWNGNDKTRSIRKNEFEMSSEVTCGPRVNKGISDSSEKETLGPRVQRREKYNLAEFETEYETAKFFIIKSYSEDDVHKCLKYDVWSSTAHGNKKLDAAFHDVELKAYETGVKCPIFLFFSVNGSGQFVGVAEMLGKVDFNKTMDFWQADKWSGFFPVKWHIVKDIPNSQLRHIILENNENRDVTYTRDTQEVGLKQGLEMLKIFKNYMSRTSLLDDLEFYEGREKALLMRSFSKPGPKQTVLFKNGNLPEEDEGGEENNIVDLTSKLSLTSDDYRV